MLYDNITSLEIRDTRAYHTYTRLDITSLSKHACSLTNLFTLHIHNGAHTNLSTLLRITPIYSPNIPNYDSVDFSNTHRPLTNYHLNIPQIDYASHNLSLCPNQHATELKFSLYNTIVALNSYNLLYPRLASHMQLVKKSRINSLLKYAPCAHTSDKTIHPCTIYRRPQLYITLLRNCYSLNRLHVRPRP